MNNANMPAMPIKHKDGSFVDFGNQHDAGFFQQEGSMLSTGLTKREYFAAMAMQGILANATGYTMAGDPVAYAQYSVVFADALLAELERTK